MKNYYKYKANGEIVAVWSQPDFFEAPACERGFYIAESSVLAELGDYVQDGEICKKPQIPNGYSDFNYTTKLWDFNPSKAWGSVRDHRMHLLSKCDWTQLPDVPEQIRSSWLSYRQGLRDITLQADPLNIIWPTPPQ